MLRVPFYRIAGVLALTAAVSCADHITTINANASTDARVGSLVRVQIRLLAFKIDSPPAISSPALAFIGSGEADEGTMPPGGPLWEYRFLARSRGQAIITFSTHLDGAGRSFFYDTVNVR